MTSNICRASQIGGVCTPKISDVVGLQDQSEDPVDACKNRVQRERRAQVFVLFPDLATVELMAVGRSVEGVVCASDEDE